MPRLAYLLLVLSAAALNPVGPVQRRMAQRAVKNVDKRISVVEQWIDSPLRGMDPPLQIQYDFELASLTLKLEQLRERRLVLTKRATMPVRGAPIEQSGDRPPRKNNVIPLRRLGSVFRRMPPRRRIAVGIAAAALIVL
ncbi:hypothetical protein M885DRAFT_623438 [Pelagophyceae sp. CCMP2097]|nr:hypothetical protein M885DRAFT_623438 [Pelagophyceae sp. CCMP2097]|mmetsp:Transcript_27894/g.93872  ORF Transcript_27894/g.93872 Transcript_27894/m.93872 type:complete len:139 (+) Transcript_27894:81-497(+)|eukprot:CAMPEP_0184110592 /NCGR_PEP_ID=MMETSP0974-20121125/17480_1 /TAXON_ID=483370 /ORGANISM="non described non described, Strain CCMP2097" /LENGTH=138 /DNA_ID=CAMNT_0026413661 /DNA_START=120 /DNA_END=536 /DNA_ORIENTATION=-